MPFGQVAKGGVELAPLVGDLDHAPDASGARGQAGHGRDFDGLAAGPDRGVWATLATRLL
jgi:hypothetical protein